MSGYDRQSRTFDGKPVQVQDFDVSCLEDDSALVVIRLAITNAEITGIPFAGLQQVGDQLLVVGDGDANTVFLRTCWECKWLTKAHRPGCAWKLVRDVSSY